MKEGGKVPELVYDPVFYRLKLRVQEMIGDKNPYHNWARSEEVFCRFNDLIQGTTTISPYDQEVGRRAALLHDVRHCGRPIRQEVPGLEKPEMSNEEYAVFVARQLLADSGVTLSMAEDITSHILPTTFGQSDGPFKRSYPPKDVIDRIIMLADVGGFAKGFDAWMDESFRVLEETPDGRLPQSFDAFIEGRKKFVGYCKSLLEDEKVQRACNKEVLNRYADALTEVQNSLNDASKCSTYSQRFSKLWDRKMCKRDEHPVLQEFFANRSDTKPEIELRFIPLLSEAQSKGVGLSTWQKTIIEQSYIDAYDAEQKPTVVRIRKTTTPAIEGSDESVEWQLVRKERMNGGEDAKADAKHEYEMCIAEDGTEANIAKTHELQDLLRYKRCPTIAKERYEKKLTLTINGKDVRCTIHFDRHLGPGDLTGTERVEVEFDEATHVEPFLANYESLKKEYRELNILGADVTKSGRFGTRQLAEHGWPEGGYEKAVADLANAKTSS